jgi:hypothetical protein
MSEKPTCHSKKNNKRTMDLDKYNPNTNFLLYKTDNGDVKVDVLLNNKTIWMPQKNIAELFGVGVPAISKHLKNIFESGELSEKVVVSILEITTQHGALADKQQTKETKFYNLDAIIAVGYRVNSHRATRMQDWVEKLDAFLQFNQKELLNDAGKVTAAIAKSFAESEYDKYRIIQDKNYISDFDREIKKMIDKKDDK